MDEELQDLLKAKELAFSGIEPRGHLRLVVTRCLSKGPISHQILAAAVASCSDVAERRDTGVLRLIELSRRVRRNDVWAVRFMSEALLLLTTPERREMFDGAFLSFLLRAAKAHDSSAKRNLLCTLAVHASRGSNRALCALRSALNDADAVVRHNAEILLGKKRMS